MNSINEPKGAKALLTALASPNPKGEIGIPVLLWGDPGVGKSSYIESLQTEKRLVITIVASIHDPTDFSGLPVFDNGQVKYAIPEWVKKFDEYEEGILFLDELSTAPPAVQAALLRVVLERKVGFHKLPDHVKIIAAANPPDLIVGGWELSPPLRNRFIHLNWDIEPNTYIDSLHNGWGIAELPKIDQESYKNLLPKWKVRIGAFIKLSPESLKGSPETDDYGFASPRTWDFAACILTTCELLGYSLTNDIKGRTICQDLITGCLGTSIAMTFFSFLRNMKLPDPEDLLSGKVQINLSDLDESEIYILLDSLNREILKNTEKECLFDYTIVYLEIIVTLVNSRKRDLVFIPLKEISQAQLWVKVFGLLPGLSKEKGILFNDLINKLFKEEGLKEYINVFH